MKDMRNNDLKRKLSQMRGRIIHTFEFQIFKNEANFREMNIRCVIKLLKENLSEDKMSEIAANLKSKINLCTLYEFYSVVTVITEGCEDSVVKVEINSTEEIENLLKNTDFLREMSVVEEFRSLRQILVTHEEQNTIEGLPEVTPEVTIVLSFFSEDEIIVISD